GGAYCSPGANNQGGVATWATARVAWRDTSRAAPSKQRSRSGASALVVALGGGLRPRFVARRPGAARARPSTHRRRGRFGFGLQAVGALQLVVLRTHGFEQRAPVAMGALDAREHFLLFFLHVVLHVFGQHGERGRVLRIVG